MLKWILRLIVLVFIAANVVVIIHAYKFTHFNPSLEPLTKPPSKSIPKDKWKSMFLGVELPKPRAQFIPNFPYENIKIASNEMLDAWHTKLPNAKGTVVLWHGFVGEKSNLLNVARGFQSLGYSTILVDFMGSGASTGVQSTIGYKEAENVKDVYEYLQANGEYNIYLFGVSMGAVAIMKAVVDYHLDAKGLILECPFGTMYKTVAARFKLLGIPEYPLAGALTFWGGTINGFNAFKHNPETYAKQIHLPTLLMFGAKDEFINMKETQTIFNQLQGPKELVVFEDAKHENYLRKDPILWKLAVREFFQAISQ